MATVCVLDAPGSTSVAPRGPLLLVRTGIEARVVRQDTSSDDGGAVLALASIAPEDRERVLESVRYATTRLEARLSPLGADMGDGEPVEQLGRELRAFAPTFDAARSLRRGRWRGAGLEVSVVSSCDEAHVGAKDACVPAWGPGTDESGTIRQARLLAWTLTHAAVFGVGTRDGAETMARRLRARIPLRGSTIALVTTARDLNGTDTPATAEMREAARRLGAAMAANGLEATDRTLESIARFTEAGGRPSWLELGSDEVLVVPRLAALARVDQLERDIEACAERRLRWRHRP